MQIRQALKAKLVEIAGEREIDLTSAKTIGVIREIIIQHVFGDMPVMEESEIVP